MRSLLLRIIVNISLIVINIIVFSDAFIGINITNGNIFHLACGTAVIILTIIVFYKVNIAGRLKKKISPYFLTVNEKDIKALPACAAALKAIAAQTGNDAYEDSLIALAGQIEKFESKRNKVNNTLSELFDNTEITYIKFKTTIDSVEDVITNKIKLLISKMRIIETESFARACIGETISDCDEILLKMDRLLVELSELSAANAGELKHSCAIKELQGLIDSVKWYKD